MNVALAGTVTVRCHGPSDAPEVTAIPPKKGTGAISGSLARNTTPNRDERMLRVSFHVWPSTTGKTTDRDRPVADGAKFVLRAPQCFTGRIIVRPSKTGFLMLAPEGSKLPGDITTDCRSTRGSAGRPRLRCRGHRKRLARPGWSESYPR